MPGEQYQQFSAGQATEDKLVDAIGWDYDRVKFNNYQEYYIEQPLVAQSYAAITLTWDRLVMLNDFNRNEQYDVGETFRDRGLNNLDIYLLPVGEDSNMRNACFFLLVLKIASNISSVLFPLQDVTKFAFTIATSLINQYSLMRSPGGRLLKRSEE